MEVEKVANSSECNMYLQLDYKYMGFTRNRQHVAYPMVSMLGEIGGLLGMFLGIRLITLGEILDVLIVGLVQNLVQLQMKLGKISTYWHNYHKSGR